MAFFLLRRMMKKAQTAITTTRPMIPMMSVLLVPVVFTFSQRESISWLVSAGRFR